jgi:malate dehydrogenase (oxaloacetate-decarboxylating)(NADP+)
MTSQDKNKPQVANPTADLDEQALFYHRYPRPGKLEIQATKPLGNQRDLALAYSPGVAAALRGDRRRPGGAAELTTSARSTSSPSSPTARPCWASAISDRWPPSR